MIRKQIYRIFLFFIITICLNAQQQKKFKIHTVAFYNLENLFDTINDPNKMDEASPIMELSTNKTKVYEKKVSNMARVIADIGLEDTHNAPAIIGVSEAENRSVLEDLANTPELLKYDYGIVHYESPDERGIDVALLYQKKIFIPTHTSSHTLKIYDDVPTDRDYTRDQLLVTGKLDGEEIHVIVNHWPSRSGGEIRSRPKREAAAKLTKHLVDSLQVINPYAKIFIMGDLNDNPTNASIKNILKAKEKKSETGLKTIYNPMENLFKNGLGTTAYRDSWSLFDQILITAPLLKTDYTSYRFYKAGIYNKNYLVTKTGTYRGYPYRSFGNEGFTEGYSDHFPVYVYLIKAVLD